MRPYVYDLETLINCFTATFVPVDSDEVIAFVIHDTRSDFEELIKFLQQDEIGLIGFNNLKFDYPILHYILTDLITYRHMNESGNYAGIASMIHNIAQNLITSDGYVEIAPWSIAIPQRDIFRIHHFDNVARRTSLKHVEIAIKWHNVQDMPIAHDDYVEEYQIKDILDYNLNDVLSTKAFYLQSHDKIVMRRNLGRRYNLPLMNANDAKIGEAIMLKYIAEKTGVEAKVLKQLRTERNEIVLSECILPTIKFKTKGFNDVLTTLMGKVITQTKGALKYAFYYDNMKYEFGLGGLHAVRDSSVWESNDTHTILSVDVASYYPNLAIKNRWYPEHLGTNFCDVYEELYIERRSFAKGTAENAGLKLALNGAYGKSNDKYSFLYDPKFTMQITLNGQLLLAMLCEKITENTNAHVVMCNTDGIEVYTPNEDIDRIRTICSNWEKFTNLTLEEDLYDKLWIRDVNNYVGLFNNGEVYTKGAYEWDGKAVHKDQSMLIVPRAVQEYFINGTPIIDTLKSSTDIFEFCLSMRTGKDADFYMQELVPDGENHNIVRTKLQRTNRFIVTKKGGHLVKVFKDGKETQVRHPYCMTVLNVITDELNDPMRYEMDFHFYELECNKLISGVLFQQMKMF